MKYYYYNTYDNYLQESKTYEIEADNVKEARTILIDHLASILNIEYPKDESFYEILDLLANKYDLMIAESELVKL